jgi:hypothetical protein
MTMWTASTPALLKCEAVTYPWSPPTGMDTLALAYPD